MNDPTVRPPFGSLAEQEYFDRHGAAKHAETAATIDRCIDFAAWVPLELCRCDEQFHCPAHRFAFDCAQSNRPARLARGLRLLGRWR